MPKSLPHYAVGAVPDLSQVLRNTGVSVLYQDLDLNFLGARNVPAVWAAETILGANDRDILPEAMADRMVEAKRTVLAGGGPQRLEISLADSDGARWYDVWVDADLTAAGAVRGVITTMVETTDQKRREQTLRTLLREVSHRSKNLLAIIQSIAAQTGRYSLTIDTFLNRFRGRLQSLASSQDLVTSSNWRGADLHELVLGQVARYSADPQRSIRFAGASAWLTPNAALHLGLALHELAVNSVSFGALSRADGFVTVSVRKVEQPETALVFRWSETIPTTGAVSGAPATWKKRFGSVALERVVPMSLNGTANLGISDGQLEYRLVIPTGNFSAE